MTSYDQNGASSDAGSGLAAVMGAFASARLSLRIEFVRTVQKIVAFRASSFLDFPFSRWYFELTSCPSTRTWSPLWSVSAMDSPRRLKATTRCQPVFDCHSSCPYQDPALVAANSAHATKSPATSKLYSRKRSRPNPRALAVEGREDES